MEKVKIVTKIQTTACTVSTYMNAKWRCRLFYSTADVAVRLSQKHCPYLTIHHSLQARLRTAKERKRR